MEIICEGYRIIYYITETKNKIYILYILCKKQNPNLFFKIHKNEILKLLNQ